MFNARKLDNEIENLREKIRAYAFWDDVFNELVPKEDNGIGGHRRYITHEGKKWYLFRTLAKARGDGIDGGVFVTECEEEEIWLTRGEIANILGCDAKALLDSLRGKAINKLRDLEHKRNSGFSFSGTLSKIFR